MTALRPKKPTSKIKQIIVWITIISALCLMWDSYHAQSSLTEKWTIEQVITAAKKDIIIEGNIKAGPGDGFQWHTVYGKAKSDKPVILLNGQKRDYILFSAEGRLTESRFNELVTSSDKWKEIPNNTVLSDLLMGLLPYLVFLLLIYFLFYRIGKNSSRGPFSFSKSKARLFFPDENRKTFKDFAGYDEAKEEVAEIVDFLKSPEKYKKIGAKIPKGCLMVGPPGTGKTLLAKAIAGEANVPFFNMSGSDFVEMYVGLGAARVRDTFAQARKNAPCIVFIDEIDAVGRHRGAGIGGGNDEREQTLNSLLVEMDGFDESIGVIIIAATNRPDVLDQALLRPGRFDRQVTIDLPDLNGRLDILRVHAKRFQLKHHVSLKEIARHTSGFSGADLENLLNEAGLLAARYNKKEIDRIELDEAYDKVAYGRERRKLMDEKDKKITAYHEAGHAIIQAIIDAGDMPVHKVTILPRGQSLGSTMFIPKKDILNYSRTFLLNDICCAMGGRVAEEIEFNELTSGAAGDIKAATKRAKSMVCDLGMSDLGTVFFRDDKYHSEKTEQQIDDEISKIIKEQYERAKKILHENYTLVQKLADALLKYETIEGKHVYELVKSGDFVTKISTRIRPKAKHLLQSSNNTTDGKNTKTKKTSNNKKELSNNSNNTKDTGNSKSDTTKQKSSINTDKNSETLNSKD